VQLSACEQFPDGLPKYQWKGDGTLSVPPTIKPTLNLSHQHQLRQVWCSLIEHFSLCEVTRASDKTIAIAGLASVYQKKTNDTYPAGLWKSDLYQQLCLQKNNVWDTQDSVYIRTTQYHGPSWSWVSIDGPVLMDSKYFRPKDLQNRYSTCFLKLLDTRIESETPEALHSFKSCDIRLQAIGGWASVQAFETICEDNLTIDIGGQIISLGWPNSRDLYVSWDEDVPQSLKWAHHEQWCRIQQERRSKVLFVLVYGQSDKWCGQKSPGNDADICCGLLLRPQVIPEGDLGFSRMGYVQLCGLGSGLLFDLLATKLELASNERLGSQINLDDPRLVGLVHTITMI